AAPDGRTWEAEGVWEGDVADGPRGDNGFGYDPIFIATPDGRTAAQLPDEEKNVLSHRARAAQKLVPVLQSLCEEAARPALSHVDERGRARMVDVTAKDDTQRVAVARG